MAGGAEQRSLRGGTCKFYLTQCLPPALRHWKPEQKSKLPPPDDRYLEYEAAIKWGYHLHEWQTESVVNRARCMAHHLHAQMREAYETEQIMKKGKKKVGVDDIMASMGI